MHQIRDEVGAEAKSFGITVVDVRLRRADLPPENSEAIYARMQSERQREAQEFRAQGDEFAQRIKAVAERERTVILADAQRQAQILRGEGDGETVKIYADAFGKDKDFFAFYRSMEAYRDALAGRNTTLVLSPDGDFFKFFNHADGLPAGSPDAAGAGSKVAPPNPPAARCAPRARLPMKDLSTALALALAIEGMLYALFPDGMKRLAAHLPSVPASTLRAGGLLAACLGVAAVWLVRR
jgi:membrane protease subunit HflC